MRRLLHMPLDPGCRVVRVALAEKCLPVQLEEAYPWEDAEKLAAINPAGVTPVLIDDASDGETAGIAPSMVILEYLEDAYPDFSLYPSAPAARAETRRLVAWFTDKLEYEVIAPIIRERIDKRLMRRGQPDYDLLRAGLNALDWHFDYFAWLLDQRAWLAGEAYSAADVAAAGYLSALDYVDAAPWDRFPTVKEWYARIKSRPALRPILKDRVPGLPPPRHFDNPDF
ncbi:MAG: glutathione S-transferase family protein [Pseudomonadota bacterium]